jgi:hypothetical protein
MPKKCPLTIQRYMNHDVAIMDLNQPLLYSRCWFRHQRSRHVHLAVVPVPTYPSGARVLGTKCHLEVDELHTTKRKCVSFLITVTRDEIYLKNELSRHRSKSIFCSHQLDGLHPITLLAPCSYPPPPSSSGFLALIDGGRGIHNRSKKEELTKQRHPRLIQRILPPSLSWQTSSCLGWYM